MPLTVEEQLAEAAWRRTFKHWQHTCVADINGNCLDCGHNLAAVALGKMTSQLKAEAARKNGAKGGRPKKPKPDC